MEFVVKNGFKVPTRCSVGGCNCLATKKIVASGVEICLCDDCFLKLKRAVAKVKLKEVGDNENAEK